MWRVPGFLQGRDGGLETIVYEEQGTAVLGAPACMALGPFQRACVPSVPFHSGIRVSSQEMVFDAGREVTTRSVPAGQPVCNQDCGPTRS